MNEEKSTTKPENTAAALGAIAPDTAAASIDPGEPVAAEGTPLHGASRLRALGKSLLTAVAFVLVGLLVLYVKNLLKSLDFC